jgi:hypothetical protein
METSSGSRVRRDGDDGDVVEAVGPAAALADPDLDGVGAGHQERLP